LLVVAAAFADARGAHGLAFDALLAAIPFAAGSALAGFGDYLEQREDSVGGLQALLWTLRSTCSSSPAPRARRRRRRMRSRRSARRPSSPASRCSG